MKKILVLTMVFFILEAGMALACTREQAQMGLQQLKTSPLNVSRQIIGSMPTYQIGNGWYGMSYDDQHDLVKTLVGIESCLTGQSGWPLLSVTFRGSEVAGASSVRGITIKRSKP
ncbi:MAG: hypothetical protein FWG97_00805 [Deltaproteobacteria bacterium]|nr:hypothetical protein [Deltaproteobacteria bacterium]